MATETPNGVVNITEADKRLITVDEVRRFEMRLNKALLFAETANLHLSRLDMAFEGELGDWPKGYVVTTEAVAAFALLADALDHEAQRMQEYAANMRRESCHLWWDRGPEVSADAH